MTITLDQLIVWVIVGSMAGNAAGALLTLNQKGFGAGANLAIGLIGAIIGGVVFSFLDLTLPFNFQISLEDIVSAFAGAVLLVVAMRLLRRRVK
ncbi:MAG: GlsB/YeaQ/YmgE family stress response membrane protein [Phototrophicaceae bacterium]